jgi:hypothetical protein
MLNRTIFCVLTLVTLLVFPVLSFAEFKIVVKKNGKIIEGKLANEDETSVTIISAGTRLRFLKKDLDLERMKEVNAGYLKQDDVQSIDLPAVENAGQDPKGSTEPNTLADLAKQNRDAAQAGQKPATTFADSTEKAFADWVAELEQMNKVVPSEETEIELSKAKKGMSHYRARSSQKLSTNDRKMMLEQLVKALDFNYRKALEREAPDDELKALKKQIKEKEEELEKLSGE